jgi:hypothetical protein
MPDASTFRPFLHYVRKNLPDGFEIIHGFADTLLAVECFFWRDNEGRHVARFVDPQVSFGTLIPNVVIGIADVGLTDWLVTNYDRDHPKSPPLQVRILFYEKVGDLIP